MVEEHREGLELTRVSLERLPAMSLIRTGFWLAVGWLIVFPVVMFVLVVVILVVLAAVGGSI
jgi:hypothetical protein